MSSKSFDDYFHHEADSECWHWHGGTSKGVPRYQGKDALVYAHIRSNGVIGKGLRPVNTCGNKLCVNPEHAELRTIKKAQPIADNTGMTTVVFLVDIHEHDIEQFEKLHVSVAEKSLYEEKGIAISHRSKFAAQIKLFLMCKTLMIDYLSTIVTYVEDVLGGDASQVHSLIFKIKCMNIEKPMMDIILGDGFQPDAEGSVIQLEDKNFVWSGLDLSDYPEAKILIGEKDES